MGGGTVFFKIFQNKRELTYKDNPNGGRPWGDEGSYFWGERDSFSGKLMAPFITANRFCNTARSFQVWIKSR